MPVVVAGEARAVADAGTPAPVVVPQADSLQAVVADDEIALVTGATNTPLPLDKSDFAVMTLETTLVL